MLPIVDAQSKGTTIDFCGGLEDFWKKESLFSILAQKNCSLLENSFYAFPFNYIIKKMFASTALKKCLLCENHEIKLVFRVIFQFPTRNQMVTP